VTTAGWPTEVFGGSAAEHHAREVEAAARAVWWLSVSQPALVLGSSQRRDVVDELALERAGVELVRRRSGGGAVLLVPGEVSWVDVILPAGDPLWDDDVGRAAHWLGAVWERVAAGFGTEGARVHRGPMVRTSWSPLVCFAGLGPGEVQVGERKLVGISQRRTKGWARFQCAVHRRWDPAALVELLRPPRPTVEELAAAVATLDVPDADLCAAFLAALP
jgi:lipoate-protein ligase A